MCEVEFDVETDIKNGEFMWKEMSVISAEDIPQYKEYFNKIFSVTFGQLCLK